MTLTVADVPKELDDALRLLAKTEGKTFDEMVLDVLRKGLGESVPAKRRDLSKFAGSWVSDPQVETALQDQDKIDAEMWR